MIGCLIISERDNVNFSIETIIESHLQFYHYEQIEEIGRVVFLIWNMKHEVIWQLALTLETSNVKVGYGFGESKEKARKKCEEIYNKRLSLI